MALSEDLIDFDLIDQQKENIAILPGGRSARALAQKFSPQNTVTFEETRTLNDAIRKEYEIELQSIEDSDDPLDIYVCVQLVVARSYLLIFNQAICSLDSRYLANSPGDIGIPTTPAARASDKSLPEFVRLQERSSISQALATLHSPVLRLAQRDFRFSRTPQYRGEPRAIL